MKNHAVIVLATIVAGCCQPDAEPKQPDAHRAWAARVGGAVFSPDGRSLLTGYTNDRGDQPLIQRLVLWNVDSEVRAWSSVGKESLVPIAFLPKGKEVLIRAQDSLQIWDVQSGQYVRSIAKGVGDIRVAKLSEDGALALTGGENGSLVLWKVSTGERIRTFAPSPAAVKDVAISPDNKIGLVKLSDRQEETASVKVWNLETGDLVRQEAWPCSLTSPLSFTGEDAHRAVVGLFEGGDREGKIAVWDPLTGTIRQRLSAYGPFALSPRLIAIADRTGTLAVLDIATGGVVQRVQMPYDDVDVICMSSDGKLVFTARGRFLEGGETTMELVIWHANGGSPTILRGLSWTRGL